MYVHSDVSMMPDAVLDEGEPEEKDQLVGEEMKLRLSSCFVSRIGRGGRRFPAASRKGTERQARRQHDRQSADRRAFSVKEVFSHVSILLRVMKIPRCVFENTTLF